MLILLKPQHFVQTTSQQVVSPCLGYKTLNNVTTLQWLRADSNKFPQKMCHAILDVQVWHVFLH